MPKSRTALAAEDFAPYLVGPSASAPRKSPPLKLAPVEKPAAPFLKWAGGKTQLLSVFESFYPPKAQVTRFIEPFLGGGAVFFHVRRTLEPQRAFLFDRNDDLITTYAAIKSNADEVVRLLLAHRAKHSETHYYKIRAQDAATLPPEQRAARFIYLNKTCYNGLYRVNSRNQFNVPMGRYVRPSIVDPHNVKAVAASLAKVHLATRPFTHVTRVAREGDFVYFDPPYDPVSASASFTSYTQHNFTAEDQTKLAQTFALLSERGCMVMLSNSDTPFVRKLYQNFHIHRVPARRSINTRADKRGSVWEVVVTNYVPPGR
ncbi:MAG: DNA adenine methylase [Deltaproteobacteria bacterium]|nr:DNA adenine methylase [Deltaproteobacteria bacterium]